MTNEQSDKNAWVYFFLLVFFGVLGIHKFYINKVGMGLVYFFSAGLGSAGVFSDYLALSFGSGVKDNDGKVLAGAKSLKIASLIVLLFVIITIIIAVSSFVRFATGS